MSTKKPMNFRFYIVCIVATCLLSTSSVIIANLCKNIEIYEDNITLIESAHFENKNGNSIVIDDLESSYLDLETLNRGNNSGADLKLLIFYTDKFSYKVELINHAKGINIGRIEPKYTNCNYFLHNFQENVFYAEYDYFCILSNNNSFYKVKFMEYPIESNSIIGKIQVEITRFYQLPESIRQKVRTITDSCDSDWCSGIEYSHLR